MIDLHMHSNYSDGTDNIKTLLTIAESLKLEYISITDHNTCKEYYELNNIDVQKYYKGNIINGIELSTKVLGIPIEILAYNFDINIMQQEVEKIYISPKERNILEINRLFDKAKSLNLNFDKNYLETYDTNMYASKFFHNIISKDIENKKLIDEESWNDSNVFYRKYMSNPNTIFYIDTSDILPDIEEIVNVITKANGLLFIPHIFEYRENAIKILNYILDNYMTSGIECYYTTFTDSQVLYLTNLCHDRKLYMSGGSDYHGNFKPNVFMGRGFGNLAIDKSIINNWL